MNKYNNKKKRNKGKKKTERPSSFPLQYINQSQNVAKNHYSYALSLGANKVFSLLSVLWFSCYTTNNQRY